MEPTGINRETSSAGSDTATTTAAAAERFQRDQVLRQLDILGTEREAAFDQIVALAAHVCGTSVAGVTLVDGEREWLKAEIGLGLHEALPICAFTEAALRSPGVVLVEDARTEPVLCSSPVVVDAPHLRSFAAVALHSVDGIAVGVLFVADARTGVLDPTQREMLTALAHQVEHLLELRRSLRLCASTHEEVSRNQLRLQRILDAITQGVVVHRPDGSIEQSNPAAERILGLSQAEICARTVGDARWQTIHRDGSPFPGSQRPASVTLRYGVAVHDVTFGVVRPDGERRWVLVNSMPLPFPALGGIGAVSTFSDITDVTELNDRLHESLRELADGAQERAALLSAVSHDIRAPLASIRMMTEILEDRADAISDEQRSDLIRRVRVEARRTEGALADLVFANRVGTGLNTPSRQRVDLDAVVRSVVRDFADDDHTVQIGHLDGDLRVWSDRAQLERILDNLISNAVRHTPAGSHVTVSAVSRDGRAELAVADDGPGVSDHLKARIFEAYVRGERSEHRPGSGLGLFLVQQFAQFHGGRAWCEDVPGGGARFVVAIPQRAAERPDPDTAQPLG